MHEQDFPAPVRAIAQLIAWLLVKPLLWVVDKLGLTDRLWGAIGRKMRQEIIGGNDFGAYRPTAADVIVCTFPKCGTHWAMQAAHQIATRATGEFNHLHEVVPWPDFAQQSLIVPLADDAARLASPTGLRVIKTHLEWARVPYTPQARYLCVLRDPKDAFVSSYHFIRDVFCGPLMRSVKVRLQLFCSENFPFSWPAHVRGYWSARDLPNRLILTFGEMKSNPKPALARIAKFMGVELTAEEFADVQQKSSFAYMKAASAKFKPPAMTPLASPDREMIRRGESGRSDELLSATQQRLIDDWCRDYFAHAGSRLPYEDLWGRRAGTFDAATAIAADPVA